MFLGNKCAFRYHNEHKDTILTKLETGKDMTMGEKTSFYFFSGYHHIPADDYIPSLPVIFLNNFSQTLFCKLIIFNVPFDSSLKNAFMSLFNITNNYHNITLSFPFYSTLRNNV